MASTYGENLRFTIFGQSHSPAIGVTIEGLPAGLKVDMEALSSFLRRRAPGNSPLSTSRKEADIPQFLSGLVAGYTCGTPITVTIANTDIRPQDYVSSRSIPRPGHADYTAGQKFGPYHDHFGGGHFSGRLTAGLCVVGGICKQLLEGLGITIAAHIRTIGQVEDTPFDPVEVNSTQLRALLSEAFPALSSASAAEGAADSSGIFSMDAFSFSAQSTAEVFLFCSDMACPPFCQHWGITLCGAGGRSQPE